MTDLHATVLHLLGLDNRRLEIPGRKRLEIDDGKVIQDIIANPSLSSVRPTTRKERRFRCSRRLRIYARPSVTGRFAPGSRRTLCKKLRRHKSYRTTKQFYIGDSATRAASEFSGKAREMAAKEVAQEPGK